MPSSGNADYRDAEDIDFANVERDIDFILRAIRARHPCLELTNSSQDSLIDPDVPSQNSASFYAFSTQLDTAINRLRTSLLKIAAFSSSTQEVQPVPGTLDIFQAAFPNDALSQIPESIRKDLCKRYDDDVRKTLMTIDDAKEDLEHLILAARTLYNWQYLDQLSIEFSEYIRTAATNAHRGLQLLQNAMNDDLLADTATLHEDVVDEPPSSVEMMTAARDVSRSLLAYRSACLVGSGSPVESEVGPKAEGE